MLTTRAAAVLVLAAAGVAHAQPLTTAFTYQGELLDAGVPVTGPCDLRFRLFDAPSGGAQLGPTLCANDTGAEGGRFAVLIDFGAQFAGQRRFLEVEARLDTGLDCSNASGFVTLSPRQEVGAAPNALFSLSAAAAEVSANATQLNGQAASFYLNASNLASGTIPNARTSGTSLSTPNTLVLRDPLGSISATGISANNIIGAHSGSGAGLTNLNASNITSGTLVGERLAVPLSIGGNDLSSVFSAQNASTSNDSVAIRGVATGATGSNRGVYGATLSPSGAGVMGEASTGAAAGVYGFSPSSTGYGLYGWANATNGLARGVYGQSNSTSGIGVYARASATSGAAHGVLGLTSSVGGAGVFGECGIVGGLTTGVQGQVASVDGRGVYGRAYNTNAGTGTGVWGESAALSGRGVYGVATAASGLAAGVVGEATGSSGGGIGVKGISNSGVGVRGETSSGSGYGVEGRAPNGGTGVRGIGSWRGGHFSTSDGAGIAVEGSSFQGIAIYGDGGIGVRGDGYRGVEGRCDTANNYGVMGLYQIGAFGPLGAYGVFAFGPMGASGTKSFRIDHPADPENKYLLHYCSESPEPQNVYNGMVTLDDRGDATVVLPSYFAAINKDPRYTLTAVGAPMPMLHVGAEIDGAALSAGAKIEPGQAIPACSFRIAGGAPGGRVSWRVDAVRNDRWMQLRGAPVEIEKPEHERGTYQHPELFGQPEERGTNHDPAAGLKRQARD
jgi:hypothetical protein